MKNRIHFLIIFLVVSCSYQTTKTSNTIILKASGDLLYFPRIYTIDASKGGEIHGLWSFGLGDTPDWSPDGNWIVFSTQYAFLAKHDSQIYIMRSNGTHRIKVASDDEHGYYAPIWSPDGTQIVYRDEQNLYRLNVNCILKEDSCNLSPIKLTKGIYPDWSPDGGKIIFVQSEYSENPPPSKVIILDLNNLESNIDVTPANTSFCHHPKWSPDGRTIVLGCNNNILVMDSDGKNVNKVGIGVDPDWSPDGEKITYVSSDSEGLGKGLDFEGMITSEAIFIMNADGSNIKRLSLRNDEDILWYSWIP
jgi:Tol biopolymer transport system component